MNLRFREYNGILRCQGSLDIRSVEEFQAFLSEYLRANPNPAIDLSEIEDCDAAGLQLLIAARKQASKLVKQLEIRDVSSSVQTAALTLGIAMDEFLEGVRSV